MKKSIEDIAREVIQGLWGAGEVREESLTDAGYDYDAVQSYVNKLFYGKQASQSHKDLQLKGIDVSVFQGDIDWAATAKSIDYAILRAGFGGGTSLKDGRFDENYTEAKKHGVPIGAYWYSYATTVEGARAEAQACLEVLKGRQFEYPIYYDIEEIETLETGPENVNAIAKTFCDILTKAGYCVGIYTSTSQLLSTFDDSIKNSDNIEIWVADWRSRTECPYTGKYGMWQYGLSTTVKGVAGDCDGDFCYVDYPSLIKKKGLNGYRKPNPTKKPKYTVEELANQVIIGLWGCGEERKKRLTDAGYDYSAVQDKVNEILYGDDDIDEIANEVIRGLWGAGEERKKRLTEAGYDYSIIQGRVNEILNGD